MSELTADLTELLAIMARLRDPKEGCEWDLKQSFASIVPHTLEEAYEVADTIERKALSELPAELGDLLYQIIFYCQIAKEQQLFDFNDVTKLLKEKLIRRHPEIFADAKHNHWDALKRAENPHQGLLSSIPTHLPALSQAQKQQNRAATVGFDWPSITPVIAKLQEEITEFEEAYAAGDQSAINEELGDILFVCANLARHAKLDAEQVLRQANRKFARRFGGVE
jgi:ATP diphosphatase